MKGFCGMFKGKKITLMGLGLLGRGVGDAEFLAECGAEILVTDKKSEEELAGSVAPLKKFPNVAFHLGGHRLEDFTKCDMVIKAAGVPLDSPEIAAAREAGIPVYMSTALFAKYAIDAGATLVGITGTRGKTTTAQMIFHCLKLAASRQSSRPKKHVFLGGNVRGLSTLAISPQVEKGDIVVLELDSWQLQGFGDLKLSPHIAVFTNLMPDHQNYYKNMDEYFADKANIFLHQHQGETLICGEAIEVRIHAARPPAEPRVAPSIPPDWTLQVIGQHNRENAALAALALAALGLSQEEIRAGLESFAPVEGRLQFVREVHGAKIYNDNNATTPEATIAALKSLPQGLTLIAGGSEKGLELMELVQEVRRHVGRLLVLTHPKYLGSERFKKKLQTAGVVFEEAGSLSEALQKALKEKPDTVLFSPGFASFGMFKNEYERNDEFARLVKAL